MWKAEEKVDALYRSHSATSLSVRVPRMGFGTFLNRDRMKPRNINMLGSLIKMICNKPDTPILLDVANAYETREVVAESLASCSEKDTSHVMVCAKGGCTADQVQLAIDLFGRPFQHTGSRQLDMYLWHHAAVDSQHSLEKLIENWKNLVALQEKFGIKVLGLSNIYPPLLNGLVDFCRQNQVPLPAVLQAEMHILCPEFKLVAYLQQNGICPIAYSPLGFGNRRALESTLSRWTTMPSDMTPSMVMLGWNMTRGVAVIPQTLDVSHLLQNISVYHQLETRKAEFESINHTIERKKGDDNLNFIESALRAKSN